MLTDLRCLLLSHPHPVHRRVLWAVNLEAVRSLNVVNVPGLRGTNTGMQTSFGGGRISTGTVDPTFSVQVDHVDVFIGDPDPCGELQQQIDDARSSRCVAVFGRVVPFEEAVARDGPGLPGQALE